MKKTILTLGILTVSILFTGCASKKVDTFSGERLESLTQTEKIKMDFSDKNLMAQANYYTFSFTTDTCVKVDSNILRKSYSAKIAELKEVDQEDLTETDLKKFFISGLIKNGLWADKNYQQNIMTNQELKNSLLIGKYNGKIAFKLATGATSNMFFFENENDCKSFLNIK